MTDKNMTKSSNWRKNIVEVKGESSYELHFTDTQPNMFFVQNTSNNMIYFGISDFPTLSTHEFEIFPKEFDVFGRPFGTKVLYILNSGSADAYLQVYSYAGEFDMSILKKFAVNLDADAIRFDGVITGFKGSAMLPAGTNKIGSVEVSNQTWQTGDRDIVKNALNALTTTTSDKLDRKLSDVTKEITDAIHTIQTGGSSGGGTVASPFTTQQAINIDAGITDVKNRSNTYLPNLDKKLSTATSEIVSAVQASGGSSAVTVDFSGTSLDTSATVYQKQERVSAGLIALIGSDIQSHQKFNNLVYLRCTAGQFYYTFFTSPSRGVDPGQERKCTLHEGESVTDIHFPFKEIRIEPITGDADYEVLGSVI